MHDLIAFLTGADQGSLYGWLSTIDPITVYIFVFSFAFVENIFPPSPSDLMIVAGGSLIGAQRVGFVPTLFCATAGSTLGFMAMYFIGKWFGEKIVEQGKLRFLPRDGLHKVEAWFQNYGYWVVVINRFLTGTRAVVSFFAGMSELRFVTTTVLCGLSALLWNTILVAGGWYLGSNWEQIGFFLNTYSQVATTIVVVGAVVIAARFIHKRLTSPRQEPEPPVHPEPPAADHPVRRHPRRRGRGRRHRP